MNFEFLSPLPMATRLFVDELPDYTIGRSVILNTEDRDDIEVKKGDVVIFSVNETRNVQGSQNANFEQAREEFYSLYKGNWDVNIIDLGEVLSGASVSDTYFAVTQLVAFIHDKEAISVMLGGGQDLVYANYRAYPQEGDMVNIVNIDNKFDLGNIELPISNNSYIGKIVVDKPYNLFNYTNLGFQSYFVAPEELDVMERMFFDAYRLGNVSSDISQTEAILRDADIVSVDMNVVEASFYGTSPNGFSGKQICALCRYAGISDRLNSFGIYEFDSKMCTPASNMLLAQMLWYFVEGVCARWNELGGVDELDVIQYQVPVEEEILVFYKSQLTGRWWLDLSTFEKEDNKLVHGALLPCTSQDYTDACNQKIPERWYKARMKYEI